MKNPVLGRGHRGFTLIELLVVMALMMALVGIGLPALQLALRESKIRGIANQVKVLTQLARLDAMRKSHPSVVQIIPSTGADDPGHVQAFVDLNEDSILSADETVIASFPLPKGISFTDCSGKTDKDSVDKFSIDPNGGPNIAIFKSTGELTTEEGAFRFGDTYGNYLEVYAKAGGKAVVRKCGAGGVYFESKDNEKAWTWQ